MKGFDILHLKSATKAHNKFDLSCSHLTTMDMGQIVPLYSTELVPGDQFDIKASFFSRLSPMVKPTYGRLQFKTACFFVPYYQIDDSFESFLAANKTHLSQAAESRYILLSELYKFYIDGQISTTTGASATNFDLVYKDTGGATVYRLFTLKGKYAVKVLNSLGYAIPQNVDLQTTSIWSLTIGTIKLSAMPIIAFAKAYNDYMSISQRYNNSTLSLLLDNIKKDIAYSGYYDSTNHRILKDAIYQIIDDSRLCYENDYFTSAWQRPESPIGITDTKDYGIIQPQIGGNVTDSLANNNGFSVNLTQGDNITISERNMRFLQSFYNFVKRNNYAGSRDVQRIFARFGVKPEDYHSNFCHLIGTSSSPVQIGDVTQTTPTASPLGDYAGKGILSSNYEYKYRSSDYGMLMIFGWYAPQPMMSFGFDKSVLRVSPYDFYQSEFDGLGAEPIPLFEVYASPKASDSSLDNSVFGFTERYNSYRFGRDKITGDFRNFDNSNPYNTWHFGRYLDNLRASGTLVAQSVAFLTMPAYDSEFDRIFSVTSGVDNFFLTCYFDVKATRPMLNLSQVPQLGEGDTNVPRNGNVVN